MKVQIGAHIDGFAAVTGETIVVGATPQNPVTGRRADVLKAAYTAAEVAMRLVKVGNKNWAVTDAVNKVAAAWGCKPVEGRSRDRLRCQLALLTLGSAGMLSCHQEQNVIDGKKRIVLNPSEAQKREFEAVTFAEGEIWGIDILVSSGEDGKVRINFSAAPRHFRYAL